MPTTLSPTALACVALSKIGAQAINSLLDTQNFAAITVNQNFDLCYLELSRARRWNCLMTAAELVQVVQTPLPGSSGGSSTITATAWAQSTFYAANSYVTYGNYYYQVMYDYTSSLNFENDLTNGALTQTDQNTYSQNFAGLSGCDYASSWQYQYALPDDFQFLAMVNGCECGWFGSQGDGGDWQIMGSSLFCNQSQAVIQYVKNVPDCTQWDSMFANAFTLKLASAIATPLRQDGGRMEAAMMAAYNQALSAAGTKNGNEQKARRFNIISSSNFNRARNWSQAN